MTIKQQGGIFGRNPTFNNVEVDGKLNGGDLRGDSLGVGVDSLSYQAEFAKAGSPSYIMVNTTGASASGLLIGAEGTLNAIYSGTGPGNLAGKPLFLYQGFTHVCNTTAAGNLAFPSGQGIDFSATAGTGTSELFDDYEEGTWTATVGCTDNATTTTTVTGYYTKIGRQVTVGFRNMNDIVTTGLSGFFTITLPFAVNSGSTFGAAGSSVWDRLNYPAGYTHIHPTVSSSGTTMLFTFVGTGIGDGLLGATVPSSGTTDIATLTLTYFTD